MRIGIALGSNLGDRVEHLKNARKHIENISGVNAISASSSLYETTPVDCAPGAPLFLNAVMEIEYVGDLFDLLAATQAIERTLGRPTNRNRNADRPIDIDLLYAENFQLKTPELTLTHPRLAQRRFVLEPLTEIRSKLILPGYEKTIAQLLESLHSKEPPLQKIDHPWIA